MYSIKNSIADCSKCELLDAPSCILETNCKDDLTKVDVIFIAENPGKDEVVKEVPLIGKAGQTFRTYFNKYDLNKMNYLITNTVLCQTILPDGTTGNPNEETIDLCKVNCFHIIETCKPKLIVLLGTSPMNAFGLAKSGITNLRGQFFKWKDFDVFLTIHPSFVNRQRSFEEKFAEDMRKVSEFLGAEKKEESKDTSIHEKGVWKYKIPEHFYTNEYRLVDVQFINKTNESLYIFRDKNNKKVYHKESDDYYCYQAPKNIEARKIVKFDDLNLVKVPYKQKSKLDPTITYEGDIKLSVKRAMDYFILNKEEAPIVNLNTMFLDIEIYSTDASFPDPTQALHPIVILTYYYHGKYVTYVLDHKVLFKNSTQVIKQSSNSNIIVCKNEKELVNNFLKDLKELEPDIITGWNVINFDLAYIFNRMKKLGIVQQLLSKFGDAFIDAETSYASITGLTILDQLVLYREFELTRRENYRLGTIAQIELKKEKLDSGEPFNKKFERDINDALEYNIRDVNICVELEEGDGGKVKGKKHIALQNELKNICKSSFRGSASPFGRIDSLSISYLKEKGFASRNSDHGTSTKFEGAFVKEPIVGLNDWIVDFDFASLYPSLILTYNIGLNTFVAKLKETEHAYYYHYDKSKLPEKITLILDPTYSKKEIEVSREDLIKKIEDEKSILTISGCIFKNHEKELSFYSEILDLLLSSRKVYKNKMFEAKEAGDESARLLYNTRQQVYKILANAMYGVLGNASFRFFDRDCGRSVTLSGQEAIKTSILEGNNYVNKIKTGKLQNVPKLEVSEMYGDLTRKTPYIITGDTDSLFATYNDIVDRKKSREEIIQDVNKWNEEIENYLNKTIIPPIVTSKNVDIKKNRLALKNELVIDRGLFLAKKRYALHVIAQEKKSTDDMDSKGVEIKRSDFPSYTKKCLSELLDMLLRSEKISLNKINEYIKIKEKEITSKISEGDKTVARPVSFTMEEEEYKKIPQGVIGMQNWNNLMYDIFRVGSRGYLYKISGIDFEKAPKEVIEKYNKEFVAKGKSLDIIVVPDEEAKLPSYFIPDRKAMIQFAWTDRYNLLLEPIMEVKRKQEVLTF